MSLAQLARHAAALIAILFGAALGSLDWYLSVRFIRSERGLDSETD